jgi:hypothetical protein
MDPAAFGLPSFDGQSMPKIVLSNRDLIALAASAFYKLGGGHWLEAFAIGLALRILMHEVNYPPMLACPAPVQLFAQQAGGYVGAQFPEFDS